MKTILFGISFLLLLSFQNCSHTNVNVPENSDTKVNVPENWKEGETKCPVHNEILKKDTVEITYALVSFKKGYLEAKSQLFPFANTNYLGGDIVGKEKKAVVAYCDQCRAAQKKWLEENKNTPYEK